MMKSWRKVLQRLIWVWQNFFFVCLEWMVKERETCVGGGGEGGDVGL